DAAMSPELELLGLQGRVAIVTGAASGIGQAAAQIMAATATYFGVTVDDLCGSSRSRTLTVPNSPPGPWWAEQFRLC
ncbi:hypothetical protein EBR44_05175, partial [bacterium]|nr:hypothetical protein [bacterium]